MLFIIILFPKGPNFASQHRKFIASAFGGNATPVFQVSSAYRLLVLCHALPTGIILVDWINNYIYTPQLATHSR
jgi:hypothetical protein